MQTEMNLSNPEAFNTLSLSLPLSKHTVRLVTRERQLQEVRSSVRSAHRNVEGGDHVQRGGEDGGHALDRGLIELVVGGQYLPVRPQHTHTPDATSDRTK